MGSGVTWLDKIHVGDCRALMRQMIDAGVRVNCIVTSPPYWGLRDYGMRGAYGLERTPIRYVARMRSTMRVARELLADDGVMWLNLGDCYATGAGKVGDHPGGGDQGARWRGDIDRIRDEKRGYRGNREGAAGKHEYAGVGPMTQPNRLPIRGLKPKDLIGMPWRVAFALQADGWWLRSDVVWSKPNPMPESIKDRPTKSHEYVFLMTRAERYHYDADAIAEPAIEAKSGNSSRAYPADRGRPDDHLASGVPWSGDTRNARTVWQIATSAFPGAHFATFPRDLVRRCILAGSRPGDTVFDPFMGSGTVAEVALSLGRRFIGCELNPEYAAMFETHRSQQVGMGI
jgi:DNA modification methylase